MVARQPRPEDIRAALGELLGWQGIARSPQLGDLLRYVVEKTLAGDEGAIKAYSIAVDVLGRSPDFDPQVDPIVRVQARRLRTLLEQYYATGLNRASVQIRLPLGRYVPEFLPLETEAASVPDAESPLSRPSGPPLSRRRVQRRLNLALLAAVLTVAGVVLTIGLLRWLPPDQRLLVTTDQPQVPRIVVGPFDNLTGNAEFDLGAAELRLRVITGLSRFEEVALEAADAGVSEPTLRVAVQESSGRYVVRAILSEGKGDGIAWTTRESFDKALGDPQVVDRAAQSLVVKLASSDGPLHAPGRAWLGLHGGLPATPNHYVCALQFMLWRSSLHLDDALDGMDCFGLVLAAHPDDALALAGNAGIAAWRLRFESTAGDKLDGRFAGMAAAAARAVTLRPESSFVYEMQALVLAEQGSYDAAFGALRKAIDLNPANIDAQALLGLQLWQDGQFSDGLALAEAALEATPSPAPWYYTTRAFAALRDQRYFDAVDAAQSLGAGDEELGPVLALAAAPRAGRADLVDRYRAAILKNPQFQASGVLPRLSQTIRQGILLDRIRDGLTLAGVPPNALVAAFNPDGSAKG